MVFNCPSEGDSGSGAGVTHWRDLQGILKQVQNNAMEVNPLRDTPHPSLPQSGEGAKIPSP